jgi:Transcription factor WhiB
MTNNPTWPSFSARIGPIPALDEASCRGDNSGIFDAATDDDAEAAARICLACPAIEACRQWARAQPADTINGVCGAELYLWASHSSLRSKRKLRLEPVEALT